MIVRDHHLYILRPIRIPAEPIHYKLQQCVTCHYFDFWGQQALRRALPCLGSLFHEAVCSNCASQRLPYHAPRSCRRAGQRRGVSEVESAIGSHLSGLSGKTRPTSSHVPDICLHRIGNDEMMQLTTYDNPFPSFALAFLPPTGIVCREQGTCRAARGRLAWPAGQLCRNWQSLIFHRHFSPRSLNILFYHPLTLSKYVS